MKHPNPDIQKYQAQFLADCPAEQREFHARMFRLGNADYFYHQEASFQQTPTLADYEHWLEGLPENIRQVMQTKGFEECKTALPFTRHVMERRDIGMADWMKKHLSEEDYQFWKKSEE